MCMCFCILSCMVGSPFLISIHLNFRYNYFSILFHVLHAEVVIGLTDEEYTAHEATTSLPLTVSKNLRLANPITLHITPYSILQAMETGLPLPPNTPTDNNPYSPIYAKSEIQCHSWQVQ